MIDDTLEIETYCVVTILLFVLIFYSAHLFETRIHIRLISIEVDWLHCFVCIYMGGLLMFVTNISIKKLKCTSWIERAKRWPIQWRKKHTHTLRRVEWMNKYKRQNKKTARLRQPTKRRDQNETKPKTEHRMRKYQQKHRRGNKLRRCVLYAVSEFERGGDRPDKGPEEKRIFIPLL